ncbi:uncharacterized protein LOC112520754 isoform X2 [Cynara cardunculus var. scolymus]|uniref:uncharacterized protein LOC112520754 isoform X2 n=1 Tax=Cynara cardunculus var. scolymus TaxID=59895 RepID=UPI000D630782|nr:uncharacterized protein LOC112520754 isoform X2 [Cynara cardunculus var. scolymus]
MADIKVLSSDNVAEEDRMVEIELEAAEALAELAHVAANRFLTRGGESDSGNPCFNLVESFPKHLFEDQANFCRKESEKTSIWTAKPVKDEQNAELPSTASYPTKYASSSGRKSRQRLTEAEKEARKIRRVLANRESARQTIRRRQAIYEELTRKAADLAWENKNLKRKKEMASKEFDSLKDMNERLKAQMVKVEADEIHGESRKSYDELNTCSSSTNSPFIKCNWSPFLPLTITNSSSSDKGVSTITNGITSPLYVFPHPWLFAFLHNDNEHHPRSFNLNEKPIESSQGSLHSSSSISKASMPIFPKMVEPETSCSTEAMPAKALDGTQFGGPLTIESKTRSRNLINPVEHIIHEIHQVPVVCSGKKLCDMAAASEARKRRKHLQRQKDLHWRQLRMH